MKGHLTQLEKKINQVIKIIFRLAILLMQVQALTTSIAKLSSMSRYQDLSFSKEDQG